MVNPEATGNPTPTNNEGNAISRVTIKIPPFWHDNPEIWFAQVEAQFSITGTTTDLSKFNTVVGAIESRILNQVTQAVLNPPQTDKYENLKKGILGIFSDSEHKKISKLLSDMSLGDQKPSQQLNEMRRLGGVIVTEEFLKTIWLQNLPEQTRAIVSAGTGDMKALAAVADKVEEVRNSNRISNVNCTNQGATNQPKQGDVTTSLERKIDGLTKAIQSMTSRDNAFYRSRSQSRGRNQNRSSTPHQRSKSSTKTDDGICWYHRVYGDKADKCSVPHITCSYVQKKPKKLIRQLSSPSIFHRSEYEHCVNKSCNEGAMRTHGMEFIKRTDTTDDNSYSTSMENNKFLHTKIQQLNYINQQMKMNQINYPLYINRLLIADRKNSLKYLIDSGADVSVIPASMMEKGKMYDSADNNISILAANGTKIKTFGYKSLQVNLGLRRSFIWTFIIADVHEPIIGADFIKHYKLLIDLANNRLIDQTTLIATIGSVIRSTVISIKAYDSSKEFDRILEEFPEIVNPNLKCPSKKPKTYNYIDTKDQPTFARPRRLAPNRHVH